MRKLMNKKGFSLVELMIVVVIMGILIAVAIPLYGAIQTNANNKTCSSNIKSIKTNAASYKTNYNTNVSAEGDLQSMFDDGALPECPLKDDGDHSNDYEIVIASNGAAKVACKSYETDKHTPEADVKANTISAGIGESKLTISK